MHLARGPDRPPLPQKERTRLPIGAESSTMLQPCL